MNQHSSPAALAVIVNLERVPKNIKIGDEERGGRRGGTEETRMPKRKMRGWDDKNGDEKMRMTNDIRDQWTARGPGRGHASSP